jgi:hypothetical protein
MPMKALVAVMALGLLVGACKKPDSGASSTSASGASPSASAAPSAAAAPSAPAPAATPASPAFVQKGIKAGNVVVGYIQDATDPNQCAAVTDAPAKKDDFTKNGDKLAQMVKGKLVPSCPTDNVVGTCNAGFGLLVNYSGPKWTADTAKKDCASHPHQKWVD